MYILFIGDIVGAPGREAVKKILPGLQKEYALDFVVANAENVAGGSGITQKTAEDLFSSGVDVLTSGDHIWKRPEIFELIEREERILRPANFPAACPGRGYAVYKARNGSAVGVVNINGRVFMPALDCPFHSALHACEELRKKTRVVLVDVHAEATSEKAALGWHLDGKASAVIGTHTHIQTADERMLPQGAAYLTDAGMTGPYDSVIGRRVEDVLARFLTAMPVKFEVAKENTWLCAALIEVDGQSGRAESIQRIQRRLDS
jgi:metallophosphoesterase (TIGR00282 family)